MKKTTFHSKESINRSGERIIAVEQSETRSLYPSHEGDYSVEFDFSPAGFTLESGSFLNRVVVNYQTYGTMSEKKDNVIYIAHALTGGSLVGGPPPEGKENGWWEPLVGPGKAIDTDRFFVISSNVLGGCYGTTGPSSLSPSGKPYAMKFPVVTIRDMVRLQKVLMDYLGIEKLQAVEPSPQKKMDILGWLARYSDLISVPVVT